MKIKNFTSLPAKFISVSPNSDDNPLYTRAKLKVFYVGETVDHRLFTDNFSKFLMGSLPYTPVVSYYNSDKDDFEGHAEEQCIYGIVDPVTQPEFVVEEDGTKWAICDVILYTERPDKTGEIAQKIIGHPESLELDPRTVQYKINRDRTGKFMNLEFTYGKFIGVSVLGKDEKPAFAGAQFFNSQNFLKEIKDCTNRGTNMTIVIPNFVSQSWSETERAVADALAKKFNDGYYLVDMYDTYCIVYLWDEKANSSMLMKVPYTCEIKDGTYNVTFGDAIRVHVTYEDMKAQATPDAVTQTADQTAANASKVETQASAKPENAAPITPVTAAPAKPENATASTTPEPTKPDATTTTTATAAPAAANMGCGGESDKEKDPKKKKPEEDDESDEGDAKKKKDQEGACAAKTADNKNVQTNTTSETTLSNSELEELKAYRKQAKLSLIDTYSESLGSEVIKSFKDKVDTYSKEDLTNALNAEFVKVARSHSQNFNSGFSWIPDNENSNNDEPISADDKLAEKIAARKRGNK
jgi:hypothetical protein